MDMRKHIAEQATLAVFLAEDGAYHSAARILRALAAQVQKHADRVHGDLEEAVSDPINLAGSGPAPIEPREE